MKNYKKLLLQKYQGNTKKHYNTQIQISISKIAHRPQNQKEDTFAS